ncbi:MAG: D-alanyl-D-alanine carboxypeptidase/D-alanyl-D-alanine-endopeptidase [Planctomycetes bacterium]|nr:D-alanyl-D-alanine carboxypeptidase/D-alanyl-D-alanine-endopeptidase [Planctomycetota bacterium]
MRGWLLAVCWSVVLVPSVAVSARAQTSPRRLQAIVAEAERLGARTGVAVADRRGTLLYRHRSTEAFAPASNQKIVTALAFLDVVGSDFEFETRFLLRDGVLVVEASGDPNWRTGGPYDPAAAFDRVAAQLRDAGIRAVREVRLDAGPFTGPDRPPEWPGNQLHLDYCAPTSPFLLDAGMYRVRVTGAGAEPLVEVVAPAAGVRVRNELKRATGKSRPVYGAMDHGDDVLVHGRYGALREPFEFEAVMQDPAAWYERLLRWRLQAGGIAIADSSAPGPDRLVAVVRSPLRPALERVLEDSSNVDAEQCVRVLGARLRGDGSLAGGVAALRARLEAKLGGWPVGAELHDGSGLTAANRLTPGLLVATMLACGAGASDNVFRDCLPVAGVSGTLEDRFTGSPLRGHVRAKTGWIRGASSLSGIVESADGELRYFSILMNYDPARSGFNKQCKQLQEQMVEAIAALEPQR